MPMPLDPCPKTAVLLNPRSRHGKTGKRWLKLEPKAREVIGDFTLIATERAGHAPELVQGALEAGFERIVCVGGDGTLHEAINGFFTDGAAINPEAVLALIPFGTGCDFARSVDVPKGAAALEHFNEGHVHAIDVGRITTHDAAGASHTRYFLNASHTGLGGKVAAMANQSSKKLGGFLTFLGAVIGARLTTKAIAMSVEVDGERFDGRYLDVIVTNGQFDGGGIHVAPRARLDDGVFDVYAIGDFSYAETAANLWRLYRGRADEHPKVTYARGSRIVIVPETPVQVSPDGELAGVSPVEIEVVPKALRVLTGPRPLAV